MKHLGIFSTSADIQNALNNNALVNPYIALSGISGSRVIDYNTLIQSPTSVFSNISITSNIEYTTDAENIIYSSSSASFSNFNYVEIDGITQEIKNYILNGDHSRWYKLQNNTFLESTIKQDQGNGDVIPYFIYYSNSQKKYNKVNMIKYDDSTDVLYLSRGFLYNYSNNNGDVNGQIPSTSIFDPSSITSGSALKIFYDNSLEKFIVKIVDTVLVETDDIFAYNTDHSTGCPHFIPSILINYIENYHNNIWDGSTVILTNDIKCFNSGAADSYEEAIAQDINTYLLNKIYIDDNNETDYKFVLTNNEETSKIYLNLDTLQFNLGGGVDS